MQKKILYILLVVGIMLIGIAGYLYFRVLPHGCKKESKVSNTVTTTAENDGAEATENTAFNEKIITESKETTTETVSKDNIPVVKEHKQELPSDFVWDAEKWGEPPQIVYDFAENQERIESIMKGAEELISEGNGFSTWRENKSSIFYYSGGNNIKDKISNKMQGKVEHILKDTKFYELTKEKDGNWVAYYDQEEDRDRFIFIMEYKPGVTDEQAYEEGYYRVVGDWFFGTIWKI